MLVVLVVADVGCQWLWVVLTTIGWCDSGDGAVVNSGRQHRGGGGVGVGGDTMVMTDGGQRPGGWQ